MTEDRKPETPGMAEVSAKFVDEAEAAGNSLCRTAIAEPSDELILALWREHKALKAQAERYDDLAGQASALGDKAEFRRCSKLSWKGLDEGFAIEKRIAHMMPQTARGWAVQAEILMDWVEAGSAKDDQDLLIAHRIAAHFKSLAETVDLAEGHAQVAPARGARSSTEQSPDNAVTDLESALTDLDSGRQALGQFLEDHMQDHPRMETGYCILNTLDQTEHRGRAAWKVLWEARPLHAGNRDKPPLKAVEE